MASLIRIAWEGPRSTYSVTKISKVDTETTPLYWSQFLGAINIHNIKRGVAIPNSIFSLMQTINHKHIDSRGRRRRTTTMLNTFDNVAKQQARKRERERQLAVMEQAAACTVRDLLWEDDVNIAPIARRMEPSPPRRTTQRVAKRRNMAISIAVCLFVLVMIITGLGVGRGGKGAKQGFGESTLHEYDKNSRSRYNQLYDAIIEWGLTSQVTLNDSNTPQARALEWLTSVDVNTDNFEVARTRYALTVLYFSTNEIDEASGATSRWKSQLHWRSSFPVCLWHGVECFEEDNTLGHVRALNLSSNGLAGTIPQEIGLLFSDLQVLDLGNNDITGSIPPTIEHLESLGKSLAAVLHVDEYSPLKLTV